MFFREYLRVFIPLAVLLTVYRAVAVPIIEPRVTKIEPIARTVASDRNNAWWREYFKPGSWQLEEPMMAETAQGTILLFGKLERLAADRLRLAPLTILIPQKDPSATDASPSSRAKRRAIVINDPQGTEIQFRGPIDFLGGQLPPVKGGQMIGDIEIFAPPSEGDADDGLFIETRELRIDRRHIWTTDAVKMKIGRSRVEGRDLSIYLDQDLLSSKSAPIDGSETPLNGLYSLELIYVDRVHIDLPDDGLFAEKPRDRSPIHPPRPAHAEIHCDGAFHFDFHESLATLANKVELRHLVEGLPPDTFQCDQLQLHFRWNQKSTDLVKTSEADVVDSEAWSIDRIEAIGANTADPDDASRWVRLEAPSMNARGQGRWLRMELKRGYIALANHLPGLAPNDSSQVYLQRDTLQVWSPEIEYESHRLLPSSTSTENDEGTGKRESLGRLWAAGPGQAAVASDDGDAWRLSWAKSLQLQPDGDFDLLRIDGSANARSERKGRFSADDVDLWLRSLPRQLINRVATMVPGYEPAAVLPDRMHASGRVDIHTAQLRAQVTDMQIWFNYPEIEAAKQSLLSTPAAEIDRQHAQTSAAGKIGSTRQFTTPPNNAAVPLGNVFSNLATIANGASAEKPTVLSSSVPSRGIGQLTGANMPLPSLASNSLAERDATSMMPMNVTGEALVAKVTQTSQAMLVDDLALSGMFTVTRDASPTSSSALSITGSQLRMDSSDEGRLDATIVGSPARLAIGTGTIESQEIRFNERRQMVWIDQPGSFRIPAESMQNISTPRPATTLPQSGNSFSAPGLIPSGRSGANDVEWVEPPEVHWRGRMVFDGRVARIDGGIQLTGRVKTDHETLWHLDGRANELLFELQEPITIGRQPTQPAKIATIQLRDAVDIKSAQTDLNGTRRQLDHLEVPELTILVPTQQWRGTGPGSLRSRRIGNANPASPQFINRGVNTQAPNAETRNPQAELQCLHLRFRGRMEGDMNQQLISFHDRVETLLQPILRWDETPDVHLVDRLKLGQTSLTCDQLSVYNTAKLSWNQSQIANDQLRRDAAWEITAAGHVVVESVNEQGSFAAMASRAQYAAIHSMLRIEGVPREPAIFEQTPAGSTSGEPPIKAEISSGAINLKTGEIDSLQISHIRANLNELNAQNRGTATPSSPSAPNAVQSPHPGYSNSPSLLPSARDSNAFQRP